MNVRDLKNLLEDYPDSVPVCAEVLVNNYRNRQDWEVRTATLADGTYIDGAAKEALQDGTHVRLRLTLDPQPPAEA